MKVLLFGENGWIGSKLVTLLESQGHKVIKSISRMEYRNDIFHEINISRVDRVIISEITKTHNVDWCEEHKPETLTTNIGVLNVVEGCRELGIHCTLFSTGCIYNYDSLHQVGGLGFKETDPPNFISNYYSYSKALIEDLIKETGYLSNTLILRVRMPISETLNDSKNFITKISKYQKVINVPNSISVLPDLLPISIKMLEESETGIYNFCNPGVISHNDCLEYYKLFVDPDFEYQNFTIEEQNEMLKVKRPNNYLNTGKLESFCRKHKLKLPGIHTSVRNILSN
jgi:dTDP-4-dehydrorhamnose reductase